jgi:hypothetical protein
MCDAGYAVCPKGHGLQGMGGLLATKSSSLRLLEMVQGSCTGILEMTQLPSVLMILTRDGADELPLVHSASVASL